MKNGRAYGEVQMKASRIEKNGTMQGPIMTVGFRKQLQASEANELTSKFRKQHAQ